MTEAINPNYMYLGTMTLTNLEALEDKIRTVLPVGDIERIASSKAVFCKNFHARHMPNYQEIEMMEAIQRQSVRVELLPFYNETEAVCLSPDGESCKYNTIESCKVKYKLIHYIVEYLSIQLPQRFLRYMYLTISRLF